MPKNQITRPTLAKVREAIFNILMNEIQEAVFWDLFSGSGAIGLTALSMGAKECVFVEQNRPATIALTRNIDEAQKRFRSGEDTPGKTTLIPSDFDKAWHRLVSLTPPDIVWADPPYSESVTRAQFLKKHLADIVKSGSLLVMEMQSDDLQAAEKEQVLVDPQWDLIKTRKYGNCSLVFWRRV
jgi:16S rRNA (guanine966-N2)-methyltransferase